MTPLKKSQKRGIGTVLATLIIVVASVILGSAVVLFGTSLFQTGAQQQSLTVTNAHLWQGLNGTNTTVEGAIVVRNSGDKIIALDTIQVRGATVPFTSWYASAVIDTTPAVQQLGLVYCTPLVGARDFDNADNGAVGDCGATGADVPTGLVAQKGPISLDPGRAVVVYFILPKSNVTPNDDEALTSADVGAAATLQANAGQITQVQTVTVAKNT